MRGGRKAAEERALRRLAHALVPDEGLSVILAGDSRQQAGGQGHEGESGGEATGHALGMLPARRGRQQVCFEAWVMRVLYDDDLRGRIVIDSTGRAIGEVDGVVLETDDWMTHALRVKLRKDVAFQLGSPRGFWRRPATLDLPVTLIQGVGDTVVLRVPLDRLQVGEPPSTPPPPAP